MITASDIARYLKKSGDADIVDGLTWEEGGNFIIFHIEGDTLFAVQGYGDGRVIHAKLEELAQLYGCRRIKFTTRRKGFLKTPVFRDYRVTAYLFEKEVA